MTFTEWLQKTTGQVIGEEGIKTDVNFSLSSEDYVYLSAAILIGTTGGVLLGNILFNIITRK